MKYTIKNRSNNSHQVLNVNGKFIKQFGLLFLLGLLMLIGSADTLLAQGPGYQGKRVYISYEPQIRSVNPLDRVYGDNGFYRQYNDDGTWKADTNLVQRYTLRHNIGLHYVFTRSDIFGIDFTLGSHSNFKKNFGTTDSLNLYQAQGFSIGLIYKRFNFKKKGYLAPNGNFLEIRPFLFISNVDEIGSFDGTTFPEKADLYDTPKRQPESSNRFGISIAWGTQTVLIDRFITNYTFGITLMPPNRAWSFWNNNNDKPLTIAQEGAYNAFGGTQATPIGISIDVKIGIGALLF